MLAGKLDHVHVGAIDEEGLLDISSVECRGEVGDNLDIIELTF